MLGGYWPVNLEAVAFVRRNFGGPAEGIVGGNWWSSVV